MQECQHRSEVAQEGGGEKLRAFICHHVGREAFFLKLPGM